MIHLPTCSSINDHCVRERSSPPVSCTWAWTLACQWGQETWRRCWTGWTSILKRCGNLLRREEVETKDCYERIAAVYQHSNHANTVTHTMQAHTHIHTCTHQTQSNRRGSLHTLNRPQPKDWTTVTWRHPKPPPDACNMAKHYSIMVMYSLFMVLSRCQDHIVQRESLSYEPLVLFPCPVHLLTTCSMEKWWSPSKFYHEWCTHHRQGSWNNLADFPWTHHVLHWPHSQAPGICLLQSFTELHRMEVKPTTISFQG